MSIYRVQKNKENPYVMLNKSGIEDSTLSFKARGILVWMLSKPDNWQFYLGSIVNATTDGRDAVRSGIKELEDAGYIRKIRERDPETGQFNAVVYDIHEVSQEDTCICGKSAPPSENPTSDNPTSGNPTLLINNKKLNKQKYISAREKETSKDKNKSGSSSSASESNDGIPDGIECTASPDEIELYEMAMKEELRNSPSTSPLYDVSFHDMRLIEIDSDSGIPTYYANENIQHIEEYAHGFVLRALESVLGPLNIETPPNVYIIPIDGV